jgi:hypothetical protein
MRRIEAFGARYALLVALALLAGLAVWLAGGVTGSGAGSWDRRLRRAILPR